MSLAPDSLIDAAVWVGRADAELARIAEALKDGDRLVSCTAFRCPGTGCRRLIIRCSLSALRGALEVGIICHDRHDVTVEALLACGYNALAWLSEGRRRHA